MSRHPVFTDASSAILLEKAGLFASFSTVFHLVLTESVFKEITRPGYPGAEVFAKSRKKGQVTLQSPIGTDHLEIFPEKGTLDRGEQDTICLFLEKRQGFILIDDGKAAKWCMKNHLPFINALLVPKIFWYADLVTENECMEQMATLFRIGRYSKQVKAFALDCKKTSLSPFMPEKNHVRHP